MVRKPILHYALFSPPARACLICVKIIDLDIDLKFVDFSKKEHLSQEFVRINPQHTIPVLVDEGESLVDSHVIMGYLVDKYGKNDKLYPKNLIDRARVNHRMYFEATLLFTIIKDIVNRIIYGGETEYHEKTIENAHNAYGFLEKFLLNNNYVAGDTLTLGDISIHTTLITLHKSIPVERTKYTRTSLWMERLNRELPENRQINEAGAQQLYERITSCLQDNRIKAGLSPLNLI